MTLQMYQFFNVKTNKQMVQKKSDDVTKAKFVKSWGWLEYPERTRWKFHSLKISLLVQIGHLHNDIVLLLRAELIWYFYIAILLNSVSPVTFKWQKHYAQIEFLRSLALVQNCDRHTIWVNVNKPSKQAKWHESLPCKGLILGKMHARKKTLLAGYLIPLLQSWKPYSKGAND